jgi:hypothetical protein
VTGVVVGSCFLLINSGGQNTKRSNKTMTVKYSAKTGDLTIKLSSVERRQFMSSQSAVDEVRIAIRKAMEGFSLTKEGK